MSMFGYVLERDDVAVLAGDVPDVGGLAGETAARMR